jgi:hypothetical protein
LRVGEIKDWFRLKTEFDDQAEGDIRDGKRGPGGFILARITHFPSIAASRYDCQFCISNDRHRTSLCSQLRQALRARLFPVASQIKIVIAGGMYLASFQMHYGPEIDALCISLIGETALELIKHLPPGQREGAMKLRELRERCELLALSKK